MLRRLCGLLCRRFPQTPEENNAKFRAFKLREEKKSSHRKKLQHKMIKFIGQAVKLARWLMKFHEKLFPRNLHNEAFEKKTFILLGKTNEILLFPNCVLQECLEASAYMPFSFFSQQQQQQTGQVRREKKVFNR